MLQKPSKVNKGTYVCAVFDDETLNRLQAVQSSLKLLDPTRREKLHTTIVYSRVNIPFVADMKSELVSVKNHLELWDTQQGKTLVLMLESPALAQRHEYGNILGATYDFPEYKPHITLAYDVGVQSVELGNIDIDIVVKHEKVEDLDLDWKPE